MTVVSASEVQSSLPELLERVVRGEEIMISQDGTPVARLVRIGDQPHDAADIAKVVAELRDFCGGHTTGGSSIREMIEEGRFLPPATSGNDSANRMATTS